MANQGGNVDDVVVDGGRAAPPPLPAVRFRAAPQVLSWLGTGNMNIGKASVIEKTPEELDEERTSVLRNSRRVKQEEFRLYRDIPDGLRGRGATVTRIVDDLFGTLPQNAILRREFLLLCYTGQEKSARAAECRQEILNNYDQMLGDIIELKRTKRAKEFVKSLRYLEFLPELQLLDKDV